jgi:hypothetical protein
VDLPAEQGLLVREIVPNSPAAKSGLKLYDILLRANDTQLREMGDLVELVRAAGQMQGQVTLEVLRKGQRESIAVKPEERPADVAAQVPGGLGEGGFDAGNGIGQFGQIPGLENIPRLRGLLEGFAGDGLPMEFRQFGPGVIVGQGGGLANIPNGVSVSIRKQNDQPARITVGRGDETWEIVGDDAESLNQLPEELRPFVERMLQGNAANRFNFDGDIIQRVLPQGEPPEVGGRRLRQRLENMERQVQQLLEQSRGTDQPVIDESK